MEEHPTEEEILSAVERTDFLYKLNLTNAVERETSFRVFSRWDLDSQQNDGDGSVDFRASSTVQSESDEQFALFVELLVKCVNDESPFVFLLKEKDDKDINRNPEELLFPINSYKKIDQDEEYDRIVETIPAFNHLELRDEHYFHSTNKKAVQFCRLHEDEGNWRVDNEGLYDDLVNPIIDTLEQRKEYLDRFSETIQLWVPIVVLPNDIYVVDTTKSNNPLEKTSHITFFNQLKEFKKQGRYTIDFVSEDYFLDFIDKKLNPFIKQTRNVARDKDRLLQDKITVDE